VSVATPPLFLVDELPTEDTAVLDGAEGHHASTVQRLAPGGEVRLADGVGGVADCTVESAEPGRLRLSVRRRARLDPPQPRFVVVQALPKGDRGELAVELLTELGADEIVPWAAARCVARWRPDRVARGVARWRAAARAAAKQSRRAWVPVVTGQASTRQVCSLIGGAATAVVLHGGALRQLVSLGLPATGDIVLVVGPEGGLTDGELTAFRAAGARLARLGPSVLRTSSAGAAALAAISTVTGRWN